MRDIINDLQKSDIYRIQLTIAVNFIFSKVVEEEHVMHPKSDKIESMPFGNTYEVVDELFESLLSSYYTGLET